jgi:hypothetical protein
VSLRFSGIVTTSWWERLCRMRPLMRLWEIEVSLIELFVSVVPFFLCLVLCADMFRWAQCFWCRCGCKFFVRMSVVLSSLATPPILIALSR